jgi:hypothetical protein
MAEIQNAMHIKRTNWKQVTSINLSLLRLEIQVRPSKATLKGHTQCVKAARAMEDI